MTVKVHTVNDHTGDIPLLKCCRILNIIYVVLVVCGTSSFWGPSPLTENTFALVSSLQQKEIRQIWHLV